MLAGAARSTCIIGLLDRPLFLALVAGSCTADWSLTLSLGIITELCWLDVIELGSVVPPYAGLSFLLAYPLCRHFALHNAGQVFLPLLFSLFAACLAARCERYHRSVLNGAIAPVTKACFGGRGVSPGKAVVMSGLRRATEQAFIYIVSYILIAAGLSVLMEQDAFPVLDGMTWPVLYTMALLGALLSLRTRQACVVLAGALVFLSLLIFPHG